MLNVQVGISRSSELGRLVSLSLGCLEVLNPEQQPRETRRRAQHLSWLEHLPYKERVGGSNPSAPTAVELRQLISSQVAPSQCGGDYHPNLIGDKKKSHDSGCPEG